MIRRATISRSPKYPARYTSRYVIRVRTGYEEFREFETERTDRMFEIIDTVTRMTDCNPSEYQDILGFASLKWPMSDWTGEPEALWIGPKTLTASWFDANGIEYEVNFE